MANEITVNARLECSNGAQEVAIGSSDLQFTQSTARKSSGVQAVGFAAHEAISVHSDVSSKGWAFFRNLDATNYVEIGVDVSTTFYPLVRLEALEVAQFRVSPSVTLYAKADTASVELEYLVLSD